MFLISVAAFLRASTSALKLVEYFLVAMEICAIPSLYLMYTPPPPSLVVPAAEPSEQAWVRCSSGYLVSTYSSVSDFLSGSGWQSLSATPGTLVHILGSCPRFHEGMVLTDGMGLGTWSSSSEFLLSRILLCCRKLDLFSLPRVGWFMRSCIGWSWSLLTFAACVSILVSCLSSRGYRPVTVSIADMGVLRMAPVIILMAWCCTLISLLESDFAAVELAAIPYSRTGRILPT